MNISEMRHYTTLMIKEQGSASVKVLAPLFDAIIDPTR